MSATKPNFQSVIDLGLRDVGVRNDPRGLAKQFGKTSALVVAGIILSALAICALLRRTGADTVIVVALPLAWVVAGVVLAARAAKRAPTVAVKVYADGTNRVIWLVIAPLLLVLPAALFIRDVLLIPHLVLTTLSLEFH